MKKKLKIGEIFESDEDLELRSFNDDSVIHVNIGDLAIVYDEHYIGWLSGEAAGIKQLIGSEIEVVGNVEKDNIVARIFYSMQFENGKEGRV